MRESISVPSHPKFSSMRTSSGLKEAKSEGASLVFGGNRIDAPTEGYYMEPTLFINTTNDMSINREELFAPIACVIKADNYEDALSILNDTEFGLTAGIITQSLKTASDFKQRAVAGCVMVNLPTAGTDYHVPFGGRKTQASVPVSRGSMRESSIPPSKRVTFRPNLGVKP